MLKTLVMKSIIMIFSLFQLTSSSEDKVLVKPLREIDFRYTYQMSLLLDSFGKVFQGCEFVSVGEAKSEMTFEQLYTFFAGAHQVTMGVNVTYPRHEDIHRFAKEHCSFGVFIFKEFNKSTENWLVETIIPRYGPVMRKDTDHFLFLTPSAEVSDVLLDSPLFGSKIKYKLAIYHTNAQIICKTVDLYGNNGLPRLKILKEFNIQSSKNALQITDLFPDMTKKFNGKVFRFAIPKVAFRFELEKRSDGKYHPKRGFYTLWLREAMRKFNFTYEMFYASFGGGTGKLLKNGTWVGATGDLYYGKADCSFIVGEIYSRHKFLGWSSALSYEWVIFMTHPPRNAYSAKAIFKPFTPLMWILFFTSIALMTFSLKHILHAGFDPASGNVNWSYFKILNYVLSTFIEQDKEGPFRSSSVRMLCSFWLLFAMITATVYRGKLVSLIAFPVNTWVPETFEELANSHFKVALNVVGKAGAAYVLIATSTSPVFQTITSKMGLIPEAENCLQQAMKEDLGCIIWKGIADYAIVKNLTDKNGHVPLQESTQIALFIGDGLVYERRAIFGQHLDRTIQAAMQMGLTIKWLQLDNQFIIKERKIWESNQNITRKVYDFDDGPKKLVVSQFVGLFFLCIGGILVSCGFFCWEMYQLKRGANDATVKGKEANAITNTNENSMSDQSNSFNPSDVRHRLYEKEFSEVAKHQYFHYT